MPKTIDRLAVQQSLVQNGMAEHEAAGNVANVLGDEIDGAMADLVTKDDFETFKNEIMALMDQRFEEAERRSIERELEWRREQQARDDARLAREDEWRREQQARDDKWREEMQKRDDARQKRDDDWRREQQARDDKWHEEMRKREAEAAKMTSRILWAIFGSAAVLGTAVGIAMAFTGG